MKLLDQINKIKPETGENSKLLKTIISDMESKLKLATEKGKDFVYYKASDIKLFKDVLSDIRVKMIYHIMLLQKCKETPLQCEIECINEVELNKMIEMNKKLVIRNHWLENYMKLKQSYYCLEAEQLPKMKKA